MKQWKKEIRGRALSPSIMNCSNHLLTPTLSQFTPHSTIT